MWPFKKKQQVSQITSSVGHVYDIVSTEGSLYKVADTRTKQVVGYIAHASYEGVQVNGPLTPYKDMALILAYNCAYARYWAGLRSKTR